MKRLFGELKMKWLTVILFAVIAGVYTGVMMLIPFLKNTSFQDIGITYEWWVIFAVIIVVNCKKNWEAMLKCFVFFLISQPLVYVVEALFGQISFTQGWYYYRSIWLPATLLTLPGGFIAFYCKKQNVLGGLILGVGNSIQAVLAAIYVMKVVQEFPHHLLTAVVCIASVFVMTFSIQKKTLPRMIALLLPVVALIIVFVFVKVTGRVFF